MSSDVDFLGITSTGDPGRFRFTVENHLARLDGRLYGGTAISVSIAAAELVSERTTLWMTTQFISTAPADEEISVHAEVLAPGRRTNQVRVTGTDERSNIMFASLGATGHHRPDGLRGDFEQCPTVTAPSESEPRSGPFALLLRSAGVEEGLLEIPRGLGFSAVVEFREPVVQHHPDPGPGRICMWVRRRDGMPVTRAIAAFIADMVPLSVAHGLGVLAGGISLDNTIRFGAFEPSEWVLIDLRASAAAGGYGHGSAHIWNRDGQLLATASQSATMKEFDLSAAPWNQPPPS